MPQTLTENQLDTLASRFQAAAHGYRCRAEIDYLIPPVEPDTTPTIRQRKSNAGFGNQSLTFDTAVEVGSLLVAILEIHNNSTLTPQMFAGDGWTQFGSTLLAKTPYNIPPVARGAISAWWKIAGPSDTTVRREGTSSGIWMWAWEIPGGDPDSVDILSLTEQTGGASPLDADLGTLTGTGVALLAMTNTRSTDQANNGYAYTAAAGWTELQDQSSDPGPFGGSEPWIFYAEAEIDGSIEAQATIASAIQAIGGWCGIALLLGTSGGSDASVGTQNLRPKRLSIDKSRRMAAAQAVVELENELGELDLSPDGHIKSHHPIRIYEWYGDIANEERTFTGFVDVVREGRDPRTVTLTCRDTMKRLIVQTFSTIGPQTTDEPIRLSRGPGNIDTGDAILTEENGVYRERDADYIVNDILDRAGWPDADRDIQPTGYSLDEYLIADGSSWADAIIGENALTGLTGYDAWADEMGVFHFAPMLRSQAPDSDTAPTPNYTYEVSTLESDNLTSRNIIHLDHEIDDYDLKTRVKVRGNLATAVAAWTEVWHTNQFNKPVGLWDDPTDDGFLKILDRGTKKIYRMRQSDREKVGAGIWPLDISGDVNHPLGLSGDPADSDRFWVLDAGWRTGNGNNASIHKYDASSGAHLAEYSLPDGQWSDLKVSSSFIWVTNYGTDKLHKRSKTDGTNITTYDGPTVNGNVQQNPTGVAVDGTTLLTFWDGKARFLLTDESDPEELDPSTPLLDGNGIIRTAGSKIFGGEMDTDTHAHLFACSDDLGIVWKFALTEPSTDEVYTEVADTDLEDELGLLAGAEDREHDTHPDDADHAFETRRETLTLEKTITNLAQATETALRVLDELAHRREVTDWVVVGHPGHQRGDLHQLTDPVTGIDALYILDTYRSVMEPEGRGYFATVAYVPYDPAY